MQMVQPPTRRHRPRILSNAPQTGGVNRALHAGLGLRLAIQRLWRLCLSLRSVARRKRLAVGACGRSSPNVS